MAGGNIPLMALIAHPPLGRAQGPVTILYVPQRTPVEVQLRLLRVPPRLCRERHQRGLQMFWNFFSQTCMKPIS